MKGRSKLLVISLLIAACGGEAIDSTPSNVLDPVDDKPWITLFDGQSLDGWKINENPESVRIEDGSMVVNGPRAHIFYDGPVSNHDFKNFEFRAQVMTTPGSNSGIYFHTQFQEEGWPDKGYEVQVNNSQSDWRRTGSLYNIQDVKELYAKDNEWYTEYIRVEGNRVIIKINNIIVVDYTEPENPLRDEGSGRLISSGTFAFQAHDPGSKVFYKDVMVRVL